MIDHKVIHNRFKKLSLLLSDTIVTDNRRGKSFVSEGINLALDTFLACKQRSNKIIFVGNGGSAAIASHMAIDYAKNGGIRAVAFNDASLLTCLSNDFGYESVFMEAMSLYADQEDILVAISSSGGSQNVIEAAKMARENNIKVITLTGFNTENELRHLGDINFYVPTKKGEYGFTEIAHLTILHTILDFICEGKNK